MADVKLEGITKIYPDGTKAVDALDLHIQDGEFVVLVGPSGCGKTTALRMVAGLEEISGGKLSIGDRVVNDVAPKDRDIAMVFQNYALYPHLTVADNIGFGLKLRKTPQDEIDRRVKNAAEILGLEELLHRRPKALSGGQRQRVAMGRAIVREPQAFLMDEPLSNLDAKLRVQMRAEISRLQRNLGTTTLYVTHDQVEAMTMGDRVAVMRKGLLQQVAPPQELYDHPVNLFVGGFIGSPAMNMIEAALSFKGKKASVTFGDQELVVGEEVLGKRSGLRDYDGASVVLGIRPEDMDDAALSGDVPEGRTLNSKVELREALGSDVLVHFGIDAPPVLTEDTKELAEDAGGTGTVVETDASGKRSMFVARFHPDSAVREDGEVRVAVDTERLHFFDLDSGDAIWE